MVSNPLHTLHEQAEATFLPYGDQVQIVESYGEMEAEYAAVRKGVGLMDAPHRGVVVVTGKDRLAFLQNLLTNDLRKLGPGEGVYAFLLNNKGRITVDVNVLQGEDGAVLETDVRLAAGLARELGKYRFSEDVGFMEASGQLGRLSLMGPKAAALLAKVAEGGGVGELTGPLRHVKRTIARATVTVFRNDQCGVPGYELIVPRDHLVKLWQVLHEAGNGHDGEEDAGIGMRAIGWSAFNTARIEAGTPLFGIDMTEQHLPMETGPWYERAVSVKKGCYLGQEVVARMHSHKQAARMLVGIRVEGTKLPIAGTEVFGEGEGEGGVVGIVTSSCMSPMLGYVPVAMGCVKRAYAEAGREVGLLAEGERVKGKVVGLPFWKGE